MNMKNFAAAMVALLILLATPEAMAQAPTEVTNQIAAKARENFLGDPRPETPAPVQTPPPRNQGWWQSFYGGRVYWSPGNGAHAVRGIIYDAWAGQNREQGRLGFPKSGDLPCVAPDAADYYQRFEGGIIHVNHRMRVATIYNNDTENRETFGANGVCSPIAVYGQSAATPAPPVANVAAPKEVTPSSGITPQATDKKKSDPVPAAGRGRFRVTLNGFMVNRETYDDILERDGKRDEVYIVADIWVIDRRGNVVIPRRSIRTPVMGDTNSVDYVARIQAGSASDLGGLKTGDRFPIHEAWRRPKGMEPLPNRLPLRLVAPTDVELVEGENAVVILVTVWEWDGNTELLTEWDDVVNGSFHLLKNSVVARLNSGSLITSPTLSGIRLRSNRGGDRPVGTMPGDPPVFSPQEIILTYAGAQRASTTSNNSDKGPGILELRYQELTGYGLGGDYSLFLQVESAP